jgi:hypothetical protein
VAEKDRRVFLQRVGMAWSVCNPTLTLLPHRSSDPIRKETELLRIGVGQNVTKTNFNEYLALKKERENSGSQKQRQKPKSYCRDAGSS